MLPGSIQSLRIGSKSANWLRPLSKGEHGSHAKHFSLVRLSPLERTFHATSQRQASVSMEMVKELRKRTGAPIAVVKKALVEESGDFDAAIHYLRKHGATMAAKKAHREASEGLIGIAITPDRKEASIVEVNSETDFVARTEQFGQLVRTLTESALDSAPSKDVHNAIELDTEELMSIGDNEAAISTAVSSLGENIVVRRAAHVSLGRGDSSIFGYVHSIVGQGNGKIGVLVALDNSNSEELGSRIAMHIAAAAPRYINTDAIPTEVIEKERALLIEAAINESQSAAKPKPKSIIEKMAEGRLKKWYAEVVLEEQEMLVESSSYEGTPRSVKQHIDQESNGARVLLMSRFSVGDK